MREAQAFAMHGGRRVRHRVRQRAAARRELERYPLGAPGDLGPSRTFNDLFGIDCRAIARCIAIGVTGAQQTLAEQWNGTRWRLLRTMNP